MDTMRIVDFNNCVINVNSAFHTRQLPGTSTRYGADLIYGCKQAGRQAGTAAFDERDVVKSTYYEQVPD